jgi:Icc protein
MDSIRIVQITDTHVVTDYHKSELYWDPVFALESVLASIRTMVPQPELILVTGDLVHEPTRSNYLTLKSVLSNIDIPIFVIPGNHDLIEEMEKHLISDYISMVGHFDLANVDWGIVFLDSCVDGQPHGSVSISDLAELKGSYRHIGASNVLLAMHHNPMSDCATHSCRLHDSSEFFEFLAKCERTKAVVSGHTHLEHEEERYGIKFLTTPSTLFEVTHSELDGAIHGYMNTHKFDGEKNGFRILDLYRNGEIRTQVGWV